MTAFNSSRRPPPLSLAQAQDGQGGVQQATLKYPNAPAMQAGETSGSAGWFTGFVDGGTGGATAYPPPSTLTSPYPVYQPAPSPAQYTTPHSPSYAMPSSTYGPPPFYSWQAASNGVAPSSLANQAAHSSAYFANPASSVSFGQPYNPPSLHTSAPFPPQHLSTTRTSSPPANIAVSPTFFPPSLLPAAQPSWPAHGGSSVPRSLHPPLRPPVAASHRPPARTSPPSRPAQLPAPSDPTAAASTLTSPSTSPVPMAASRPPSRSQRRGRKKGGPASDGGRKRNRPPPPRTWFCPDEGCNRSFARPSALKSHLRTHSGSRPFICPCCDRPFSVIYNLQRHMKIHPEVDISNVPPLDIPEMEVDRSLYESVAHLYPPFADGHTEIDVAFGDTSGESSGQTTPLATTPSPSSSRLPSSHDSNTPAFSPVNDAVHAAAAVDVPAVASMPPARFDPTMLVGQGGGAGALSTIYEGGTGAGSAIDPIAPTSAAVQATFLHSEPALPTRSPAPAPIEMRMLHQTETNHRPYYAQGLPRQQAVLPGAATLPSAQFYASPPRNLPYPSGPFPPFSSTALAPTISSTCSPRPEIPLPPRTGSAPSPHVSPPQFYHPYAPPLHHQEQQYLPFHQAQPLYPTGPLPAQPPIGHPSHPTESFRSTFARHRPQSAYAPHFYPSPPVPPVGAAAKNAPVFLPPPGAFGASALATLPLAVSAGGDVEGGVNTNARVVFSPAQVSNEWNRLARTPPGVQVVRREHGGIVFPVGAGAMQVDRG